MILEKDFLNIPPGGQADVGFALQGPASTIGENALVTIAGLPDGLSANPVHAIVGGNGHLQVRATSIAAVPLSVSVDVQATAPEYGASASLSVTARGRPGTIDKSWGDGGNVYLGPVLLLRERLAPDASLFVCGRTEDGNAYRPLAMRLLPSGAVDGTFGPIFPGLTGATAYSCALAPGGGLYLGGMVTENGSYHGFVESLDATGTRNAIFGSAGVATIDLGGSQEWVQDLTAFGSSVLIVGRSDWNGFIGKVLPDGGLDAGFRSGGVIWTGSARERAITPGAGNEVLVVGESASSDAYAWAQRFSAADGQIDIGFGNDGLWQFNAPDNLSDTWASRAFVRNDGQIVIAGTAAGSMAVWRLDASGKDVAGFGNGGTELIDLTSGRDRAVAAALDAKGDVFVVGWGGDQDEVERLVPNGNADPDFGDGGVEKFSLGGIEDIAPTPDGRAYVLFDQSVVRIWL